MNQLDAATARLFKLAVHQFNAQRQLLRELIATLSLKHHITRSIYRAMPPVAPCLANVLQARAAAARVMPKRPT